jgi:hypothetical protein
MVNRGVLSRKEIAKECGFSKSALDQNPRIKVALRELEESLRTRGVLPAEAGSSDDTAINSVTREPGRLRGALDAERLRRLENENAVLREEVAELKRVVERHAVLREALAMTGRVPR